MKKILLAVILSMGGYAHAAQDSVSLYGYAEDNIQDRALLSIVGSIEVSTSSRTKADPSVILNGRQRRITVSDSGRVHVSTLTPTGFYGNFYGNGSGITGVVYSTSALVTSTGTIAANLATETVSRLAADSAIGVATAALAAVDTAIKASTAPLASYANWNTAYAWQSRQRRVHHVHRRYRSVHRDHSVQLGR
jgi:hypothetical protein